MTPTAVKFFCRADYRRAKRKIAPVQSASRRTRDSAHL